MHSLPHVRDAICVAAIVVFVWAPGCLCGSVNPIKIADANTLIPGGTGTFVAAPGDPRISGKNET
ncbi:hypothetical protein ACLKMY_39115 [Paraburkholderia mimosarum]|uniref:hypothetical protein n=1 Tax=Paraburkholderia mimosarum TaxID=312026 RepID=UPI00042584A2|nr:hypothetical protein [Paraburkholderia mimosarum]